MLILKSLTEIQVLKCSVEIGITYTNQKNKTDIWETSEVRIKVDLMDSNIFVQCSFLKITYQETS